MNGDGLAQNLRFLVLAARAQLERTRAHLARPAPETLEGLLAQEPYVDHLQEVIHRQCLARATTSAPEALRLKAAEVATATLERIASLCVVAARQVRYVPDEEALTREAFDPFFELLLQGVDRIERAVLGRDVQAGLEICRVEQQLDRLYAAALHQRLEELPGSESPQSLVTIMIILGYLERMGDALLGAGEAAVSACLGESLKLRRLRLLEGSLEQSARGPQLDGVSLVPLSDHTRSGCWISRVDTAPDGTGLQGSVVFKAGSLEKLRREKEGAERWHALLPGLAPRVHALEVQGEDGSLLVEYLRGRTLEQVLLEGERAELAGALEALAEVLRTVWRRTRREVEVEPDFVAQLERRLPEVLAVHPTFRGRRQGIGRLSLPAFEDLLAAARPLEARLRAPFSVLTHGDLNLDNVLYNAEAGQVHFIDLHRSQEGDWLQDVAVFLVSNHRLQAFGAPLRARIGEATLAFYEFARGVAREQGDATFAARLGLGLVRSFASSTRFVLARGFARGMFRRARYLLERLLAGQRDLERFELPREVLLD